LQMRLINRLIRCLPNSRLRKIRLPRENACPGQTMGRCPRQNARSRHSPARRQSRTAQRAARRSIRGGSLCSAPQKTSPSPKNWRPPRRDRRPPRFRPRAAAAARAAAARAAAARTAVVAAVESSRLRWSRAARSRLLSLSWQTITDVVLIPLLVHNIFFVS
jgi:hypothetical protein